MKYSGSDGNRAVITTEESLCFARVSGDFNPLHLDSVRARRYQFGSTLIHGINGTLKALDLLLGKEDSPVSLTSLEVLFSKPVQQGDTLDHVITTQDDDSTRIEVHCAGKKTQTIDVSYKRLDINKHSLIPDSQEYSEAPTPRELSIEQAQSLEGTVPLVWNQALFADLFPALSTKLPPIQCASILATTNIVGMICPGLNSVYARLSLDFSNDIDAAATHLDYSTKNSDPRFSRVVLGVSNPCTSGEIEAFFRPAPISQASYVQISTLVASKQFSNQKALIVGGSRGLGEVTAKLLCAGGAGTVITYANGPEDAQRVSEEIRSTGGQCSVEHLNVLKGEPTATFLEVIGPISHIYYMASPLIEKSNSSLWDIALFDKYIRFYLQGLADLLSPLSRDKNYGSTELNIYVPSTIFVEQPQKGFAEYVAAKAATETFANQLKTRHSKWNISTPRLPRMLTDQTSGITGLCPLDSARTILKSLNQGKS